MQIVYIPSESMSVQGKKDEIYKRYGKDWNIRAIPHRKKCQIPPSVI